MKSPEGDRRYRGLAWSENKPREKDQRCTHVVQSLTFDPVVKSPEYPGERVPEVDCFPLFTWWARLGFDSAECLVAFLGLGLSEKLVEWAPLGGGCGSLSLLEWPIVGELWW